MTGLAALAPGLIEAGGRLLDRLIPDPTEREQAKLLLFQAEGQQALAEMQTSLSAILAEAGSADPWTSRARPTFLYVIYGVILLCVIGSIVGHLVAGAGLPGVREPRPPVGCDPGEPVVALRGRLPRVYRGAQLRQVAGAGEIGKAVAIQTASPDSIAWQAVASGFFLFGYRHDFN